MFSTLSQYSYSRISNVTNGCIGTWHLKKRTSPSVRTKYSYLTEWMLGAIAKKKKKAGDRCSTWTRIRQDGRLLFAFSLPSPTCPTSASTCSQAPAQYTCCDFHIRERGACHLVVARATGTWSRALLSWCPFFQPLPIHLQPHYISPPTRPPIPSMFPSFHHHQDNSPLHFSVCALTAKGLVGTVASFGRGDNF